MPSEEKKGITVKVEADLHAEVKQYIEDHGMTMAEFVSLALQDELHPKIQMKGDTENMRTLAFQVPDDLFRQIKEYLQRNNLTQKEFVIGLIEQELAREQTERERLSADCENFPAEGEETSDEEETAAVGDSETVCEDGGEELPDENEGEEYSDDTENEDESEGYDEDEPESEEEGFSMQM